MLLHSSCRGTKRQLPAPLLRLHSTAAPPLRPVSVHSVLSRCGASGPPTHTHTHTRTRIHACTPAHTGGRLLALRAGQLLVPSCCAPAVTPSDLTYEAPETALLLQRGMLARDGGGDTLALLYCVWHLARCILCAVFPSPACFAGRASSAGAACSAVRLRFCPARNRLGHHLRVCASDSSVHAALACKMVSLGNSAGGARGSTVGAADPCWPLRSPLASRPRHRPCHPRRAALRRAPWPAGPPPLM